MNALTRSRVDWTVFICGVIGAVCPGSVAIWLFAQAMEGNHSREGNILRLGIGILLLLTSILVLGITAIYLKSSEDRSRS